MVLTYIAFAVLLGDAHHPNLSIVFWIASGLAALLAVAKVEAER